jgi:hypothetical protein
MAQLLKRNTNELDRSAKWICHKKQLLLNVIISCLPFFSSIFLADFPFLPSTVGEVIGPPFPFTELPLVVVAVARRFGRVKRVDSAISAVAAAVFAAGRGLRARFGGDRCLSCSSFLDSTLSTLRLRGAIIALVTGYVNEACLDERKGREDYCV